MQALHESQCVKTELHGYFPQTRTAQDSVKGFATTLLATDVKQSEKEAVANLVSPYSFGEVMC